MSVATAEFVIRLLAIYVLIGGLFGIPFVAFGASRIDPMAKGSGVGFRLLTLPGAAAFWPLLLYRWFRLGSRS